MTSIIPILLQHIPQAVATLLLTIVFLNKEIRWKSIVLLGSFNALVVFFVRSLQITFGIHSIVFIFTFTIGIHFLYNTKFILALFSVIKSFIILAIYEVVILNFYAYLNIFNFRIENIDKQPITKSLLMLPMVILVLVTAFLLHYYKNKSADSHNKNY